MQIVCRIVVWHNVITKIVPTMIKVITVVWKQQHIVRNVCVHILLQKQYHPKANRKRKNVKDISVFLFILFFSVWYNICVFVLVNLKKWQPLFCATLKETHKREQCSHYFKLQTVSDWYSGRPEACVLISVDQYVLKHEKGFPQSNWFKEDKEMETKNVRIWKPMHWQLFCNVLTLTVQHMTE